MAACVPARLYHRVGAALLVLVSMFWAMAAQAQRAPALEVAINGAATRVYTREDLAALPQVDLVTITPWTEGEQVFRGVALSVLLGNVDTTATILLTALNDYTVSMSAADVSEDLPIIAIERNGEPMSVREKGPYWVIYPFDRPEFQTETFYSRSIWQLVAITVTR